MCGVLFGGLAGVFWWVSGAGWASGVVCLFVVLVVGVLKKKVLGSASWTLGVVDVWSRDDVCVGQE